MVSGVAEHRFVISFHIAWAVNIGAAKTGDVISGWFAIKTAFGLRNGRKLRNLQNNRLNKTNLPLFPRDSSIRLNIDPGVNIFLALKFVPVYRELIVYDYICPKKKVQLSKGTSESYPVTLLYRHVRDSNDAANARLTSTSMMKHATIRYMYSRVCKE